MAPTKLTGIIPPLATPLTPDEKIDEPSLKRLLEHVIAGGVSGAFVLGSTSEVASLPDAEKQRLVDVITETVSGRIKLVINVSETSVPRVIPLLRMAERTQADGIGLIAPYYYPMSEDQEILNHYRMVSQETDLPILVYNFPRLSKVTMRPDLVEDLIQTANVFSIKDSSAEMASFRQLIALSQKHAHFSALLASLPLVSMAAACGADGAITGMANIAPRLVCDLFEAARSRDMDRAAELQAQADRLTDIFKVGQSWFGPVRGMKSALKLMGIFETSGFVRPFYGHTDDEEAQIRSVLEREGVL